MSRPVTIGSVVKMGHLIMVAVKTRDTCITTVDITGGGVQTRALRKLPLRELGPSASTTTQLIVQLIAAQQLFLLHHKRVLPLNRQRYFKHY